MDRNAADYDRYHAGPDVDDSSAEDTPREWIFTFGSGHVHPTTGESVGRKFVRIVGTHGEARAQMIRFFGRKWSHQYESESEAAASLRGEYGYTELSVDMSAPPPRDLHHVYLGDGVYATFDGYHIMLKCGSAEDQNANQIALDPTVLDALDEYRRALDKPAPPPAEPDAEG